MNESQNFNIRKSFVDLIEDEFDDNISVKNMVNYLFNRGVLKEDPARRLLIKTEFNKLLKKNNCSIYNIKVRIAEKFNVSISYIEKCIYYYKDIF